MSFDGARKRTDAVPVTSQNVGSIHAEAGGKVVAEEFGNGVLHHTVLNFLALPISHSNAGTGIGFGGAGIYTFPQGLITVHDVSAYFNRISFNTEAGTNGAIGGGGSGDYSLGTTKTADGVLATTEVDLLPASAMLDPFVVGVGRSNALTRLAAGAKFGVAAASISLFLNSIIDDLAVGDLSVTPALAYFTGTVRAVWSWAGNVPA